MAIPMEQWNHAQDLMALVENSLAAARTALASGVGVEAGLFAEKVGELLVMAAALNTLALAMKQTEAAPRDGWAAPLGG